MFSNGRTATEFTPGDAPPFQRFHSSAEATTARTASAAATPHAFGNHCLARATWRNWIGISIVLERRRI